MDMRPYAGSSFVKFGAVVDGSLRGVIADVEMGKFNPVLVFEDGSRLSLNATNIKVLTKAYGPESDDWIGCEVELYAGKTQYQGKDQDSVLVRPITVKAPTATATPPQPRPRNDLDDEIPF